MYRREGGGYGGGHSGGYGGSGGFRGPQRSFAPVKVGEELEVTIEAVGEKGDGIAKKNGFVLFVPGVKEGQRVKIRVTKVLRKVGFAEVVGQAGETPAEESTEETTEENTAETTEETTEEVPEPTQDSEDFGEETEEQQ
ncbi:TRAM domain-containing protein [Candidatus Woesearchaeota archaeon]|nr:TRAM domain-containing protein [Candidatus Woesearchaeota archaeon]